MDEPEHIGFLLLPEFSMVAFSAAIEPLRLANELSRRKLYSWSLIALREGCERASNDITVNIDATIDEVDHVRTVMVCSGMNVESYFEPMVFAWLRRQAMQGARMGAVCTGSYVLARAGLLDGYRCTIHWNDLPGLLESFPGILASGELYTIDRNRFTCGGGAAATDMMLALIRTRYGADLAQLVAQYMLIDGIRPGNRLQPRISANDQVVQSAVDQMNDNVQEPLSLDLIASRVAKDSRRALERAFRKHVGISPARYYLILRLNHAHQLLTQTSLSITQVAFSCGFLTLQHFARCYRERFGTSPRTDRARKHSAAALPIIAGLAREISFKPNAIGRQTETPAENT